jgi:hypothetical protein
MAWERSRGLTRLSEVNWVWTQVRTTGTLALGMVPGWIIFLALVGLDIHSFLPSKLEIPLYQCLCVRACVWYEDQGEKLEGHRFVAFWALRSQS